MHYAAEVRMRPEVEDTEPAPDPRLQELVDELAARAEGRGESCVELSEISELAQESELAEEDWQALQDVLEARGIEVENALIAGTHDKVKMLGLEHLRPAHARVIDNREPVPGRFVCGPPAGNEVLGERRRLCEIEDVQGLDLALFAHAA